MHDQILVCSYLSVLLSILLGLCCHLVVRQLTSNKQTITHVDEFFGNFASSVFILESFVIGAKFGSFSVECLAFGFTHLVLKHTYFIALKLYASPLSFVDIYYCNSRQRVFSILEVTTILLTQIVAVLTGQYFAKFVWQFGDGHHKSILHEVCMTTLSHHFSWQHAAGLEAIGIFIATAIDFWTPFYTKPIVRSVVTLTLTWFFGHVSGLWMNPVLASVFTFRCKGHGSDVHHFLVYWIGPAIGFVLAWELKLVIAWLVGSPKNHSMQKADSLKKEE